ncbi:glycosyltransferase family 4 protein [Acidilobus sp.]|uniref:glycosyltransferase family 4 protein n=1 Tax=Acidilobus sp. TaxID=1872109 RepID=UPI003D0616D3
MKVAVVHTLIEKAGGGERLAVSVHRALRELGHEADLYTMRLNVSAWQLLAPGEPPPRVLDIGFPLEGISRNRLTRLRRVLALRAFMREGLPRLREEGYELIFETQANVPSPSDAVYIHYPALLDYMGGGGLRWAYNLAVRLAARPVLREASRRPPRLVLTNSSWTAEKVRQAYGVEARVLYPPVDVEAIGEAARRAEKEPLVLTVSRFTPEKRLEVIPAIARAAREMGVRAEFYIVGSTAGYSGPVIEAIRGEARRLGVDDMVHMEFNVPRGDLLKLYARAKVYLHPPFAEHFGIAIAEGMAAGAVPVVYRDGGGWTDMASRVDQGLGYTTPEEAARAISWLLGSEERWSKLSAASMEVARGFSYASFKGALAKYLEGLK